ncbi:hypothetical protein U0X36_25940 [Bacillus thuringiensis]|uniref:Uncharacterized protein n=2 Tax=Bacillus cereus TaxID=1396 RepID=R8ME03_BACCX|nr:hypothetical protein [Bacillus thuringiensis]EOP32337.1 hypothetical protein IK1_05873 [Bacillus cereus VD146]MDZ3956256.1 hypothetical protein [Bacillus thuringiensis]RGP43390.1 hypothetical protein BTW32_29720 [Bacillus thuringiensis]
MYVIFTNNAQCSVDGFSFDMLLDSNFEYDLVTLVEDTPEAREEAIDNGFRFVHLFEESYVDQPYYTYVTSQILLK